MRSNRIWLPSAISALNMYNEGDIIEVEIIKIVPRGLGLAFAEGFTVFIALAVKGDKL